MPKPAPKAKQVLPLPGEGVEEPLYVREGIRPKPAAGAPAPVVPNLRQADGTRQAAVPDPDQVPLDAYEGMGYAEEDVPPWEEPAPRPSAPSATSRPQPAPQASAAPEGPAKREPQAVGPAPDELNDLLSAFGEGVVFEEIK